MQQPHDSDLLADYLFGDLSTEQTSKVEAHLETCAACRDFVTLARSFHGGLKRVYKGVRPSENETCPDVSLIIGLTEDKLSESEAKRVRAHLLGCQSCMEEFLALERMRPSNEELEEMPGKEQKTPAVDHRVESHKGDNWMENAPKELKTHLMQTSEEFRRLDEQYREYQKQLEALAGIKNQHFEPGDIIVSLGDLGDSVYEIQQGECDVVREENGVHTTVEALHEGDYFGEEALPSEIPRNTTIQARTAVEVLLIPKGEFNRRRENALHPSGVLTPEEELEELRLTKLKLRIKDQMNAIISRHLKTAPKA